MCKYKINNLFPFKRVKLVQIRTDNNGKLTLVRLEPDNRYKPLCSCCKKPFSSIHSQHVRAIRDLPMSGSMVVIYLTYRKGFCKQCGIRVEHFDFVEPYERITKRFAQYVYHLCKIMPLKATAELVQLSWDQVKRIDKRMLTKEYCPLIVKDLKILSVDEINIKKHHHYLTIIVNYLNGQVIGVVKNRDYESVANYLKKLPAKIRDNIEAVAMDMWDPYIKAFKEFCPNALIIFDPFHVINAFNKIIDKIRAEQYRQASADVKNIMKKSRYILLKNPENLTESERPRLKQILKANEMLSSVYILKEYLKRIWQYKYMKSAAKFIEYWCQLALETGSKHLAKFVKTIRKYSYGLINHCKYQIHTSKLEGINNKIKVMKRKAYGYHDIEYFKLKIIQATSIN